MQLFQKVVRRISRLGAQMAAILLVGMVLHILLEIVLRSFFATSTFVLDEFVGYGIAAVTFLTLGHALNEASLIRVNLLLGNTRGKVRRGLELFSVLTTLTMASYIAWFYWLSVKRNVLRGAVSESIAEIPLWIPEGLVLLGLVLFCLQLFAYLLRIITGGEYLANTKAAQ